MMTTRTGRMGWQVRWKRVCATACTSALLAATPIVAQQSGSSAGNGSQTNSSETNPGQSRSQSQPTPAPTQKGAARENSFPSDVSRQAAQQPADPSTTPPPAVPDGGEQAPPPAQKAGQAAQDNPFPEDVSKEAAAAASKDSDPDASSSAGASSSSSSSNASGGADPAGGDPNGDVPPTTGRRKLRKPSDKDIQSGSIAGQGRAQDDVKIGRFYLGDGNYLGAYGRFSEAARFDPANVNAIYGLAASAEGLHHADEALANYKLYLAIAPDGDHAKAAEKAIRALAK